MSTEFITTAALDVIEEEGNEIYEAYATSDSPALAAETNSPGDKHGTTGFQQNIPLPEHSNYSSFHIFAVGTVAGMVVAVLIFCIRRLHHSRRKRIRNLKSWTNEIHFKDECSSDNSSLENAERGYHNYPIDNDYPDDYKNNDWLGGVGFDHNETGNPLTSASPFGFAEKSLSDSSSSNGGDDNDVALFNALNGDSPNKESGLTLDSTPTSPPLSQTNLMNPGSEISPPTVSELFQNTISPHWRMAASSLSLGGSSVSSGSTNGSINEELANERDDLNKSLFLLNDQILEQQRNLGSASEKARRLEITMEIRRLEGNKRDVELKLKAVRSKIKAHKKQRRKILMRR